MRCPSRMAGVYIACNSSVPLSNVQHIPLSPFRDNLPASSLICKLESIISAGLRPDHGSPTGSDALRCLPGPPCPGCCISMHRMQGEIRIVLAPVRAYARCSLRAQRVATPSLTGAPAARAGLQNPALLFTLPTPVPVCTIHPACTGRRQWRNVRAIWPRPWQADRSRRLRDDNGARSADASPAHLLAPAR